VCFVTSHYFLLHVSIRLSHHQEELNERRNMHVNIDVSLTVHLNITLANGQLDAQNLVNLLQSSTCTCFEQYLAHHQEVKLY